MKYDDHEHCENESNNYKLLDTPEKGYSARSIEFFNNKKLQCINSTDDTLPACSVTLLSVLDLDSTSTSIALYAFSCSLIK